MTKKKDHHRVWIGTVTERGLSVPYLDDTLFVNVAVNSTTTFFF